VRAVSAQRGAPGTWAYLAMWNPAGEIDLDATLGALPASDRDSAALLASCWPDWIFCEPGRGRSPARWLLWDGRCQHPDSSRKIDRWVNAWTHMHDELFTACRQQTEIEVARMIAEQGLAWTPEQVRAEVDLRWSRWEGSPADKYRRGLRGQAASALRERLGGHTGTDTRDWPAWPALLNTAQCVVSLDPDDPLASRPHDPALRMQYCLPTHWEPADPAAPAARCPQFMNLLWRACGEDDEVTRYLVYALGSALLGDNRFQVIFFLSGPTASGKTTLLQIVSTVLGDLAHEARPELITRGTAGRHGRHEASIRGRRLVTIGESNDQLVLDENQLKILTGQRRQSVDVIYQEELTGALISATIFVANNGMPEVSHLDGALRRRIWVIPMGESIPEHERDPLAAEKIAAAESEGILSLLVWAAREVMASEGRLLYLAPAAVTAKTRAYELASNTALAWALERCGSVNGSSPRVKGSDLLRDYRMWCADSSRSSMGAQSFYEEVGKMAGVTRSESADQVWFWGLQLL
jgi:P4 family phage/plasmid primase-like protien